MDDARIVVNFSNAYFSSTKGQYKDIQTKLSLILQIFSDKRQAVLPGNRRIFLQIYTNVALISLTLILDKGNIIFKNTNN